MRHISGFTDLLRQRLAGLGDGGANELLEDVTDARKEMTALIDDLLSFSRNSRSELRKAMVDKKGLAEAVIRDLAPEAADREVFRKVAALPEVEGDPALLKQVLANLQGNALKFTRERAPALIELCFSGDETGITYSEQGATFHFRLPARA